MDKVNLTSVPVRDWMAGLPLPGEMPGGNNCRVIQSDNSDFFRISFPTFRQDTCLKHQGHYGVVKL